MRHEMTRIKCLPQRTALAAVVLIAVSACSSGSTGGNGHSSNTHRRCIAELRLSDQASSFINPEFHIYKENKLFLDQDLMLLSTSQEFRTDYK